MLARRRPGLTKPHGRAYRIRRRCPFCGMIVNDSRKFSWVHKHQTFLVEFGGREPGGKGIIKYTQIDDPTFDRRMLAQLKRLAKVYGFKLVRASE